MVSSTILAHHREADFVTLKMFAGALNEALPMGEQCNWDLPAALVAGVLRAAAARRNCSPSVRIVDRTDVTALGC